MTTEMHISQHESRTISWWLTRWASIDMQPTYQRRGRLWSQADKGYLVDTILRGFDVPKFYLADFTWGQSAPKTGPFQYAIIDGKQRMEAIHDFANDGLPLNPGFTLSSAPEVDLGGMKYSDLKKSHPMLMEQFDNFNLTVMSVRTGSAELIDDLFVRLNRSKPLTGAEIRNAMAGPAPELVREIARHQFFTEYVRFSMKRGEDQNTATKLLMFEFRNTLGDTKKKNLDDFVAALRVEDRRQLELSARAILETLDDMCQVFLPKDELLRSSGEVPVYYWLVRALATDRLTRLREFLGYWDGLLASIIRSSEPIVVVPNESLRNVIAYNASLRSVNDETSHIERFDIIQREFKTWYEITARQLSLIDDGTKGDAPRQ